MIVNAAIAGIASSARDRALQRVRELVAAREAELSASSDTVRRDAEAESEPSEADQPQPTRGE